MQYRHSVVVLALCVCVAPAAGIKVKALRPAPIEIKSDKLPEYARMRMGTQGLIVSHQVLGVSFSGDGKIAAYVEGAGVRLVETETLKQVAQIPALSKNKMPPRSLLLSPDGKLIVGCVGAAAVVYDVANNKQLFEIKGFQGLTPFAFSTDASRLAVTGAKNTVHVWDVAKGEDQFKLEGHEAVVGCVAISPDGKHIATGSQDMTVKLWDASNGKLVKTFEGHRQSVNCLAFNSDGKFLASNGTDGIRIWNITKGEFEAKIRAPYGISLAFSPNSKTIYQRDVMGLRGWDIASTKELKCLDCRMMLGLSPDGRIAASGVNSIRFWDINKGEELGESGGHSSPITTFAVSSDGAYLASADWSGEILGWDLKANKVAFAVKEHQPTVNAISFVPGKFELYASSNAERFVSHWDLKTNRELGRFKVNVHFFVMSHALAPDGATLALAGSDQRMHLLDTANGQQIKHFVVGQLSFVTFTPDGKNIVGLATDGAVKVWDRAGKEVRQLAGANMAPMRALSADASMVATRSNDTIRLWDLTSGKEVRSWKDDMANLGLPMAFSPDGRILATGSANGAIKLYETLTGYERRELKGHVGLVTALRFTPDEKSLISGGLDGSIVVWNVGGLGGDDDKVVVNGDEFKKLWADLAGASGPKAYRSILLLRHNSKAALPLMQAEIKPAKKVDEKLVTDLLQKLENDKQAARDEASAELEKIGDQIENELRKHLEKEECSEDARRRIQKILDRFENNHLTPDQVRLCRVVEVLETMGTAESRTVLEDIAKGPDAARSTQEAKAALVRLKK